MGIAKNKSPKGESFSCHKSDRQQATIHHDSTTNSPSKNHVQPPIFAKTPSKNAQSPCKK
jgi:hypothetical protein